MASITRHAKGWRAQVYVMGARRSKVMPTRQEARDWAAQEELRLRGGAKVAAVTPLRDVLDRYGREVSPGKGGQRWEQMRLAMVARDTLGGMNLGDIEARHIADWRDRRLVKVSAATVRREMGLLGAVFTQAVKEWGLLSSNPMQGVRKPAAPAARDRLPTGAEIEALRISAGADLTNATARAFRAFEFALETAMRAGEIVGLTWDRIDLAARVAHLPKTKNGTARQVPLSSRAVALLDGLPPARTVFGLSSAQLDALWRKLRDRAGVTGLTFHDSRHAAITRLAGRVEVLALARMVGHRDIRQLLTYYNESAADLAKRLD